MTDAELHGWAAGQPFPDLLHMPGVDVSRCAICGQPWPCPTRREEERMADVGEVPDRHVLACNYAEPVSVASKGALCYVDWPNWGGGNDRVPLVVRSRGGRWIRKWEAMHRLENFRIKTIPPEHPRYGDLAYEPTVEHLTRFREACEREHQLHESTANIPNRQETP